jgi:hypothetical protein
MRRLAICAAMSAAVLLTGTALHAQAAAIPGWRQVFSKHFGVASNFPVLNAVVATSATNAWALGGSDVGGPPIAEHWNGKTWSRSALPKGFVDDITAASGPAANDIWAVAQSGGEILHWNGRAWSIAKQLPVLKGILVPPRLTGVFALSATDVWVFGSTDGSTPGWGTWHYDGKSWRQWHGYAAGIVNGSAVSPANVWAIRGDAAFGQQTEIVHYTGTWRPVTASALSGLEFTAIEAFTATNVWAAAFSARNQAQSWLLHYNGRTWSRFKLPWSGPAIEGIVADGHGGLWLNAPGLPPYEVHRTEKGGWSRLRLAVLLAGIAHIPGSASVWGAGADFALTNPKAVIWAYGPI